MDDIIQKLKTPEQCMQLAKNVRDRNPDLAQKARRRAVELRAISYGSNSEVELELLKSVYAYEEVLYEKHKKHQRASYTWRMIKRDGIIAAAEKAVNRKIEPAGYKVLAEMGLHDLTFEAVIVRYPDKFNPEAVSRAKSRLKELSDQIRMQNMPERAFKQEVDLVIKLYEKEIGRVAARTHQMIDKYGEIDALSRLMVSADIQQGFKVLRDRNQLDKTFEAVVIRFKHLFKLDVVQAAQWRLANPYELL